VELCFVDVAQGSASVILLGENKAIVIDCGDGPQARTLISLLNHLRVSTLSCLIVTHNHEDHSAGAASLLTAFQERIEQLWFIDDAALHDSVFWRRVNEEIKAGRLAHSQLYRLEYRNQLSEIYRQNGILLSVIAPSMVTNILANQANDPNTTSGVIILKGYNQQVMFTGDSTISQWRSIHQQIGRPIKCTIITMPHHGGIMWESQRAAETDTAYANRVATELNWFYTQAVNGKVGVVSVGTSNSFKHPRPEVIDAFRQQGGSILCTQMTRQCDPDLEAQRRRALPIVLPSRSSPVTQRPGQRKASNNVACAGTIQVFLLPTGMTIQRFDDHAAAVNRIPLVPGLRPLCRK
jgi:competence protein ComEC